MIRNFQETTLPWGKSLKTTYQLKGGKFLILKAHSGSWHSLYLGHCLENMSLQKKEDREDPVMLKLTSTNFLKIRVIHFLKSDLFCVKMEKLRNDQTCGFQGTSKN